MAVVSVLLLATTGCFDSRSSRHSDIADTVTAERRALVGPSGLTDRLFRVADALLLSDTVVVLNSGHRELLVLIGDTLAGRIGREGEGPGEFVAPTRLGATPSGEILVFDRGLRRLLGLRRDGGESRSVSLADPASGLRLSDLVHAGGTFYGVLDRSADARNLDEDLTSGYVVRFDRDGRLVEQVAEFPASGPLLRTKRKGGTFTMTALTPPFAAKPYADGTHACGGLAAVSTGGRAFGLTLLGPDGRARWIELPGTEGEPVRGFDRERYYALFSDEAHRRHRIRATVEMPIRHPSVTGLVLAGSGHLWVRRSPARWWQGPADEVEWWVWPLDGGRGTGSPPPPILVELPGGLELLDADRTSVLGVETDSLQREHLVRYGLSEDLPPGCTG